MILSSDSTSLVLIFCSKALLLLILTKLFHNIYENHYICKMKRTQKYVFISFLWLAGAFLLGHAFIPHHHHHSEAEAEACTHQVTQGQHEHEHADAATHEHKGHTQQHECTECHLEADFFFHISKVLPLIYCLENRLQAYIPVKIDFENKAQTTPLDYAFVYSKHACYRGPPYPTSSLV